jgi:hypothetical protein
MGGAGRCSALALEFRRADLIWFYEGVQAARGHELGFWEIGAWVQSEPVCAKVMNMRSSRVMVIGVVAGGERASMADKCVHNSMQPAKALVVVATSTS